MTEAGQPSFLAPSADELPRVLEALLFVAEEPLTVGAMAAATGATDGAVRKALRRLEEDGVARGINVMADGQRYQLVTAPDCAHYVERLLGAGPGQRLTRAALEVLTIIAYRQPCTRGEIEAIRGVNSDRLVSTLEARGLVAATGTAESPGRPRLYRTTMRFLEHFGIRSPDELPPLPALEEPETAQPF
jgi:segregation and condensation protein B